MARTHYRNGDEITLNNCNGCNPIMIQGHFCHESGCPDAWRDQPKKCFECGCEFFPTEHFQKICKGCVEVYEELYNEPLQDE